MPTALSAADAQDSEQISACRLCGQLCCPVAECEQRFEDTSFGVALNALHRQGVVEERAQRFACRRTIDPKGWRIPLRTLTPMLAPPHSESHIQLIEQSKTRAATKVKHAAPPGNRLQRLVSRRSSISSFRVRPGVRHAEPDYNSADDDQDKRNKYQLDPAKRHRAFEERGPVDFTFEQSFRDCIREYGNAEPSSTEIAKAQQQA